MNQRWANWRALVRGKCMAGLTLAEAGVELKALILQSPGSLKYGIGLMCESNWATGVQRRLRQAVRVSRELFPLPLEVDSVEEETWRELKKDAKASDVKKAHAKKAAGC